MQPRQQVRLLGICIPAFTLCIESRRNLLVTVREPYQTHNQECRRRALTTARGQSNGSPRSPA